MLISVSHSLVRSPPEVGAIGSRMGCMAAALWEQHREIFIG